LEKLRYPVSRFKSRSWNLIDLSENICPE
jgi:hypothetical protein